MSGDYSRWSFDPWRDFGAVLMQQGRVHTDADWNEWVATVLRRIQAGTLDTIGRAVVPRETPDGFLIQAAGGALTIGPGRIYVDGLLAENHGTAPIEFDPRLTGLRGGGATNYATQPYFPNAPALPQGGPHLVYLKVWQREVTAIEDPRLIEPALGVDTTTRLQTVWQVRVLPDVGGDVTCATPLADIPGFADAEPAADGRLTTGTADVPGEPDPCLVPPSGDYKGENQLFRVEIHRGGGASGADRATFKWSRDNASVASRVTHLPALDRVVVESIGRDELLGFSDGDWVEITDDFRELGGLPGEMRRIRSSNGVDATTRTLSLDSPLPAGAFPVDPQGRTTPARNTRVRRWDQGGQVRDSNGNLLVNLDLPGADGTIPVPSAATAVLLENGVVVRFGVAQAGGRFRTGDYWVFAGRSTNAAVEGLADAPPRGVHAHFAKLALVTFPDDETDCRTLWPPEVHEGGCDCSVCVTPESHVSGSLTIQAAIEQVKETGGTVCLGVGTYPLREPIRIVGARSLRVRGQGWATVLIPSGNSEALEIGSSLGVTVENLTVFGATVSGTAPSVRVRNCIGARLLDCMAVNISFRDAQAPAISLDGYLLASSIERCGLVAHTGISGGSRDDGYLVTAGLRIVDNWLPCTHRGVELTRLSVHMTETRIAGNTVLRCRDYGVRADGGNLPMAAFNICGNVLSVEGAGIVAGVDEVRIADNDVHRSGARDSDGIVLGRGLDPGGLDHCQVLGNRIRGVGGHGIAIRGRVNSGMIKHNVIADTGGGGIVMEEGGEAGVLVIENNQLLNVARTANTADAHPAAIRLVRVEELDVASNAVHGFARSAPQAASRAGISTVAVTSARVSGNSLSGIGPSAGFVGVTAGIEIVPPFSSATLSGDTLRRRGADGEQLAESVWIGVHVRTTFGSGRVAPVITLGDLAVVTTAERAFVFTATNLFAVAGRLGDVTVRGNDVEAEATMGAPAVIAGAAACRLTDNRLVSLAARTRPSEVRCLRAVIATNELRGAGDLPVLEVEAAGKTAAIVGNITTGPILLNGSSLPPFWSDLNPIGA
jgi:hypothetical protein